ncbi:MAG TPA: YhfT family protein [Candidatus Merdisoma faecalis]|nr:YhfT family protein [Candidatus Merdisoma faecalis]
MRYVIIALIGALASVLSNQGIAVFNDGFRPIVGQYFNKEISRKELAAMSFAISFGLVIGFGIPTSIAASIILIHCLLLTTDIIGSFCPDTKVGMIISAAVGAVYGLALLAGLEFIVNLFGMMPYNFTSDLGGVSNYVTVAFAVFPAVGVAYQHGFKKGTITAGVTVLVYYLIKKFGVFSIAGNTVSLNAEGMAMLAGMVMMIVFAAQIKGESNSNEALTQGFSGNVSRIRKNWFLLAIMGGLIAAGTSVSIIAGDPASLALLAEGEFTNAALTALARAIGFIPLVFTTAIVTGVYGTAGCTFVFVVGLLLHGNPILAFVVGVLVMVVEILLINLFAKGMDKFPGVKDMGEYVRTSMNKVLEVALLAGGIVAAETMSAAASGYTGIGALFVIGAFLLNKKAKKPIVDLAVGPVACIIFGILLNVLLLIRLIAVPVAG